MALSACITLIAAYLLGSVNFAIIFSNAFINKDIRGLGSGNAGATNVMRSAGLLPGILTFVCDALKGFFAAGLGTLMFRYIGEQTHAVWALPIYGAYACGLACMIGHILPVFFRFQGGKGVAICVGIFAVCRPLAIALGLVVFAAVFLASRTVSLASLSATVAVVLLSIIFYDGTAALWPQAVLSIAMGSIIFYKHKENIRRLMAGEESKFTLNRGR